MCIVVRVKGVKESCIKNNCDNLEIEEYESNKCFACKIC